MSHSVRSLLCPKVKEKLFQHPLKSKNRERSKNICEEAPESMTKVCSFTSHFWLVSAVSLPSQKKTKSSARFDSPVSGLDLGFKRGFFLKHLFSSKRLAKTPAKVTLGYSTDGLFMSTFTATPTLSIELFSFTRGIFRKSSFG